MSMFNEIEYEPNDWARYNCCESDNGGFHSHWDESNKEWETKDGRILEPTDFSTSHLKNTISMMMKDGYDVPRALEKEYERRC